MGKLADFNDTEGEASFLRKVLERFCSISDKPFPNGNSVSSIILFGVRTSEFAERKGPLDECILSLQTERSISAANWTSLFSPPLTPLFSPRCTLYLPDFILNSVDKETALIKFNNKYI